jgi:hypothetical protein
MAWGNGQRVDNGGGAKPEQNHRMACRRGVLDFGLSFFCAPLRGDSVAQVHGDEMTSNRSSPALVIRLTEADVRTPMQKARDKMLARNPHPSLRTLIRFQNKFHKELAHAARLNCLRLTGKPSL